MKLGPWSVFLIGYGLGILTSYTFFKDKYQKKAEEDCKSVREHLEKVYGVKKEETGDEERSEKEKKEETEHIITNRSSLDSYEVKHTYSGKYSYKMKDPADLESPKEDDDEDDDDEEDLPPFETTIDDYISNAKFGKMPLTWFTDDDTLMRNEQEDVDEELVDDECNYLGDVLTKSGFKYNDAPCIYVRNNKLQMIYEVTKCYGRYQG